MGIQETRTRAGGIQTIYVEGPKGADGKPLFTMTQDVAYRLGPHGPQLEEGVFSESTAYDPSIGARVTERTTRLGKERIIQRG
jgi:hypothetical protein